MARNFTSTATYLIQTPAPVSVMPLSMEAWVNLNSVATNLNFIGISKTTAGGVVGIWAIAFLTASKKFVCWAANSASDTTAAASVVASAGVWYHVLCVFASATSRTCYVNGGNSGSSAVSITTPTVDGATIGCNKDRTTVNAANAIIAFPAFYNVALTAADALSLYNHGSPRLVERSGLVRYARLTGGQSPEPDMCSATPWTIVGAPAVVSNPPIFSP